MVERFDVAIKYPCGRDPYAVMVSVHDGSYVMAAHYDAARAEIERLEHLIDLSKKTTEAVLERAEKAEAEREEARRQVAMVYEVAAQTAKGEGESELFNPVQTIRAMTPADTITALSERNSRLTAVVEEIASRQTLSGHDGDLDWLIDDARAALTSGGRG